MIDTKTKTNSLFNKWTKFTQYLFWGVDIDKNVLLLLVYSMEKSKTRHCNVFQ